MQADIRVKTRDNEWRRLDRWLAPAVQVHARNKPIIGCEGKVDGGIGRAARFTESSPDAFVPAGRAGFSEIREAQPRHVRQEHDVSRDHYRCLAGTIGPF